MRITINQFGPIDKFEYDLEKELIVTYGNNNIGKSYAMQMVYLLLKTFVTDVYMIKGYRQLYVFPRHVSVDIHEEKIEQLIKCFVETSESTKDITNTVVSHVNELLSASFMPIFLNSCKNTFGNFDRALEKNPYITIQIEGFDLVISLRDKKIDGRINTIPIYLKKTTSDFHRSRNSGNRKDIYVFNNIKAPTEVVLGEITELFNKLVRNLSNDYENVYFLPASRSGIYAGMNAFGSIVAELSKNRAFFTRKIEFPGISEPISDYFIFLSSNKAKANESLKEIYTYIEENILKGKVTFDKNKNALVYKPDNMDSLFEMTEVSSMVSEVSPIVAFLKYIVGESVLQRRQRKAILFIEEPEAHLHPNNQIALINIFSRLIRHNVKLIISSHSNYVFNKLNNLVLAKALDYKVYDPIVLEEKAEGSVSNHLPIDELGASDENFVDVSESLYNEREEIIEKMNMEG